MKVLSFAQIISLLSREHVKPKLSLRNNFWLKFLLFRNALLQFEIAQSSHGLCDQ